MAAVRARGPGAGQTAVARARDPMVGDDRRRRVVLPDVPCGDGGPEHGARPSSSSSITWRLLDADRDVAAGLVLALLLYKPQYAIPLIGLLFLSRRWRVVVGAAMGAGGLWALGAIWLEPNWLASWWSRVVPFAQLDAQVNAKNSISAPGFAEALGGGAWSILGWTVADHRCARGVVGLVAAGRPAAGRPDGRRRAGGAADVAPFDVLRRVAGSDQRRRARCRRTRSSGCGPEHWSGSWGFSQVAAGAFGWSPLFFVVAGVLVVGRSGRWCWPDRASSAHPQRSIAEIDAAGGVLSVVVPAHNEEQRIGRTLDSMASYLAGSGRVAEVIIVDDGSTDRTVEVVASYGPSFEALRIVRLRENQGKGAAVRGRHAHGNGRPSAVHGR